MTLNQKPANNQASAEYNTSYEVGIPMSWVHRYETKMKCYTLVGHSGDVSTVMCSGSHKDLLPEKRDCCLLLQKHFFKMSFLAAYIVRCKNLDSRRKPYTWNVRGS